jgi:Autographiviridae endonuclease
MRTGYAQRITPDTIAMNRQQFNARWIANENGCWIWHGAPRNGYGQLETQSQAKYAHRIAWQLFKGPIPTGKIVCHKCDVRICVNPEHLFLGSQQDNMNDCKSKGRMPRGVARKGTKLTPAQVLAIREDPRAQTAIGRDYGIHQMQVSRIKRKTRWTYL